MAAPAWQANGTAVAGNSAASPSPAWPAHAVDDIALLIISGDSVNAYTLSTPSGFAEVADSPQSAVGGVPRMHVWWCRATTTSMANPVIADPAADSQKLAVIVTFRGCIATGDPWDVTAGDTALTSTTVTIPGDTSTVADCLIAAIVAGSFDSATAQCSGEANADLTSVAEKFDQSTATGDGNGITVITGVRAAAGTFGATTATLANTSAQARLMIALKPPPADLLAPSPSGLTFAGLTAALALSLSAPAPSELAFSPSTDSLNTGLGATSTALVLSGQTSLLTTELGAPGPSAATLSGQAALLEVSLSAPAPSELAFSPSTDSLNTGLGATSTALVLSGQAPLLSIDLGTPAPGTLTLSSPEPTLTTGGDLLAPTPSTLTLASPATALRFAYTSVPLQIVLVSSAPALSVHAAQGSAFGGLLHNITRFSTANRDNGASYAVTRTAPGAYNTNGVYTAGSDTALALDASVQPYSGRSLKALPEGIHAEDVRVIYFGVTPLVILQVNTDSVLIAGERFTVFKVDGPFHMSGVTTYRAYAARQEVP